jgi:hypothetical protein
VTPVKSPARSEPIPWWRSKTAIIAGAALFLIASGAVYAWHNLLPAWQYRRCVATAQAELNAGRLQTALIAARQAMALAPMRAEPLRIVAKTLHRADLPEALLWQQQLCIAPDSGPDDLKTLARWALDWNETAVAAEALSKLPEPALRTPDTVALSAAVSLKTGNFGQAEVLLRSLAKMAPTGSGVHLNLLSVVAALPTHPSHRKAVLELETLAVNSSDQSQAARRILRDNAFRASQLDVAQRHAHQAVADSAATLSDRLSDLEILQAGNSSDYVEKRNALLTEMNLGSEGLFRLFSWLNAHHEAPALLAFLTTPEGRRHSTVPILQPVICEALASTGAWAEIRRRFSNQHWGTYDFMRRAHLARAEEQIAHGKRDREHPRRWEQALTATAGNHAYMTLLAKLALSWGWREEAAQVWWLIARRQAGQRDALKQLFALYRKSGNTRQLLDVARRVAELEPNNPVAINNRIMLALLLGKETDSDCAAAAMLHSKHPSIPAFATTHAYALLRSGLVKEALRVLKTIPVKVPEDPATSLYRALAAARADAATAPKDALRKAAADPTLFPEERELAASELRKLNSTQ